MLYLVLIYEEEVVFVAKNGRIIVKIDSVTSSYKTDTPTAKSDSTERKIRIRKVWTEFIVLNILDRIKINLI